MRYLLDSNAWIVILRQRDSAVQLQLKRWPADDIALCSIVLAELYYGALKSEPSHRPGNEVLVDELRTRYTSLPFDDIAALQCACIRVQLRNAGTPIGPNDLMIASIALAHDLTLVTHNVGEFSRVPGLKLEDWQAT